MSFTRTWINLDQAFAKMEELGEGLEFCEHLNPLRLLNTHDKTFLSETEMVTETAPLINYEHKLYCKDCGAQFGSDAENKAIDLKPGHLAIGN